MTLDWFPIGTGPYHPGREQSEPAHGAGAKPQFPRRDSIRAKASPGDRAGRAARGCAASRCRSSTRWCSAWRRKAFPTGTNSCKAITTPPESAPTASTRRCASTSAARSHRHREHESARTSALRPRSATTTIYMGFNMLDSGGRRQFRKSTQTAPGDLHRPGLGRIHLHLRQRARRCRRKGRFRRESSAIRKARTGINPVCLRLGERWPPKRKPIEVAKKLLAEAGYPDGRRRPNGNPLVIYLDTTAGGAGDKARLDWLRKQFAKLNLQLVVRTTDYNRFQDKMRKAIRRCSTAAGMPIIPTRKTFCFCSTGRRPRSRKDGENAANYSNPEYDRLFEQMKNMDNGPAAAEDHRRYAGNLAP